MKKIIVLTTATALLSSCGIYTKYQPAETTPDNLYGEEVAVDDTTNFGNVNWRELFTDPQLQALIEQGLQNNTDLRSAQLQIEEAEAALMSAKLAFLPSFALSPQGRSAVSTVGKRQRHTRCQSQPVGTGHLRTSAQCQATGQSTVCPKQGLPAGCAYPVDRRDRQRILYIVDVR